MNISKKDYITKKLSLTNKIKKLGDYSKVLLPKIQGAYDNMSLLDFVKNCNSETSRSGKDEECVNDKIKRKYIGSLSDTNYDNKKDSVKAYIDK